MDEKNVAPKDAKRVQEETAAAAVPAAKPATVEKIDPADQPFIRAENEDDDGYDPYSDRQPHPEPLFERDPWD
jgi:hypothetical protein